MNQNYWAWTGDEIIYLGAFETFNEADEETSRRGLCAVWLFCKEAMERMLKQWQKEALKAHYCRISEALSKPLGPDAVKKLIASIDWTMFHKQKLTLLRVAEGDIPLVVDPLDPSTIARNAQVMIDLCGLLHLLDAFQDMAADDFGVDAAENSQPDEEEEWGMYRYVVTDCQGEEVLNGYCDHATSGEAHSIVLKSIAGELDSVEWDGDSTTKTSLCYCINVTDPEGDSDDYYVTFSRTTR